MRISARRLRAILKIHRQFFPKKLLRRQLLEIEKLIDNLGLVREIDVFLKELKELVKELPAGDRVALQWMLAQQQTIREVYRRTMKAEIRKLMRNGFKRQFEEFVWGSLR
jgi:CHAD domain-containing protein